jgi:hypothetical protein
MSALPLPAQVVDATYALNLSAGVLNPKVSRGLSLSLRASIKPDDASSITHSGKPLRQMTTRQDCRNATYY